jgi:ParB/RepB/Spo0J family partition protein
MFMEPQPTPGGLEFHPVAKLLPLFQDDKPKSIISNVPIEQLKLSRFNPRSTRPDDDIDKLAQRISRNGFEITRALWAVKNGNGYEVFAGGTRLEAAKRAGCKEVPVVLHEGLTDEDIVRLAYEDNDNDEYHAPVPIVDVWANYAALQAQDWTHQQIADVVNVSRSLVTERIKWHGLNENIKRIVYQGLLNEAHLRQITGLSIDRHFSSWLTTESAWEELAAKAVHDKGKNGSKSVRSVKDDVDQWKEFIGYAEQVYKSLSPSITLYSLDQDPPQPYTFDAQQAFILELRKNTARSLAKVKAAEQVVRSMVADNLRQYHLYTEHKSSAAAQAAAQAEQEQALLSKFVLGDCLEVLRDWNRGPIRLLLIDPPYGKDYQSNRRWKTKAPDKIAGDNQQEAMELLSQAVNAIVPILADDAHTLIFCDWEREPEVRQIVTAAGLNVKGSLIWAKEEHSAGDVKGAFGPSHERIIHAVKGSPEVTPRIRDVLDFARSRETKHPNEKPIALLQALIKSTTNESDMVVDLFAGCGSTLVAAKRLGRNFFGVEIDPNHHEEGSGRLLREFKNG